jgi:hypothetical protein
MIKLIGTMVVIMIVVAGLSGLAFTQGGKHPNAQYVQVNESGEFYAISKESIRVGDIYTLYIKEEDNKISKKEFIVYKSENSMKGMVNLTVVKNSEKNNYNFDFNKNGWHVYNGDYNNNILLSINADTKIKEIIND